MPLTRKYPLNSRMNKKRTPASWRFWVVLVFLAAGFLTLIGRLVDLTILNRAFLVKQGQLRTLRMVEIPAYRGIITDRNNQPLAISTPVDSVWVNPAQFKPDGAELGQLAQYLQMSSRDIQRLIAAQSSRNFVYVKRGNPPEITAKIADLKIPGVFFSVNTGVIIPKRRSLLI